MSYIYVLFLISTTGMAVQIMPNGTINFQRAEATSMNSFATADDCLVGKQKMLVADSNTNNGTHAYVCMAYIYPGK